MPRIRVVSFNNSDVALCIVNSSKWKSALRWRASNDEFGERTPLKLLITKMPGLFNAYYTTY